MYVGEGGASMGLGCLPCFRINTTINRGMHSRGNVRLAFVCLHVYTCMCIGVCACISVCAHIGMCAWRGVWRGTMHV